MGVLIDFIVLLSFVFLFGDFIKVIVVILVVVVFCCVYLCVFFDCCILMIFVFV